MKSGRLSIWSNGEIISVKTYNGEDSKLYKSYIASSFSQEQALRWRLQVRTKSFYQWFGDWRNLDGNVSKFIDDNWEPLLLLHWTQSSFEEFHKEKIGKLDSGNFWRWFYFTTNRDLADKYANKNLSDIDTKLWIVLWIVCKSNNPYIFRNWQKNVRFRDKMTYRPMWTWREELIDKNFPFEPEIVEEYNILTWKNIESVSHENMEYDEENLSKALVNILKRKWYDWLIWRNPISWLDEYIVFEPSQIKSIIDNSGLFQEWFKFKD